MGRTITSSVEKDMSPFPASNEFPTTPEPSPEAAGHMVDGLPVGPRRGRQLVEVGLHLIADCAKSIDIPKHPLDLPDAPIRRACASRELDPARAILDDALVGEGSVDGWQRSADLFRGQGSSRRRRIRGGGEHPTRASDQESPTGQIVKRWPRRWASRLSPSATTPGLPTSSSTVCRRTRA